jgi:hypothetical protein
VVWTFLLANILPLIALVVIGVLWMRGEIRVGQVPEGTGFNFAVLGGALVALVLVASFSLPAAHRGVTAAETLWGRRTAILLGREPGSRWCSLLLYPPIAATWLLAWPVRFILIVIAIALLAVIAIFATRLFQPAFLQEQIDRVLAWRP